LAEVRVINNSPKLLVAIYYSQGDPRNTALRVKLPDTQEQNLGCLIAIKRIARNTDKYSTLHIEMNQKNVVELLTSKLQKMEDQGFMLIPHSHQVQFLGI
jgi:hypothetical protein